jgi:hypothetical protein
MTDGFQVASMALISVMSVTKHKSGVEPTIFHGAEEELQNSDPVGVLVRTIGSTVHIHYHIRNWVPRALDVRHNTKKFKSSPVGLVRSIDKILINLITGDE